MNRIPFGNATAEGRFGKGAARFAVAVLGIALAGGLQAQQADSLGVRANLAQEYMEGLAAESVTMEQLTGQAMKTRCEECALALRMYQEKCKVKADAVLKWSDSAEYVEAIGAVQWGEGPRPKVIDSATCPAPVKSVKKGSSKKGVPATE